MADNEQNPFLSALNPASYFFAGGPGVNLKLREKIALAQMMQKRAQPKNFGEGLTAIGEALGDRRSMIDLEAQDKLAQAAAAKLGAEPAPAVAGPRAYAPNDDAPLAADVPQQPAIPRPPPPPPPQPLPPPNGTPGNTGATTFQPPYQPPPPPLPPQQQPLPPATRALTPLSAQPPAQDFNDRFSPATGGGRQSAVMPPPGAPVMAMGGDPDEAAPPPANPRDLVALALQQRAAGGPPPNPTMTPAMPGTGFPPSADPSQGIRPIPRGVQIAQAQPEAIPGYVPPERADPSGAPVIAPGRRERELQTLLNANQGNPYAAQSPAAAELQNLQAARAQRQNEANELFKANIARVTKQQELREQGRMTQSERQQESERRGTDLRYQEQKLVQEGLKRQQELVSGGSSQSGPDPYIGTPRSQQRSGRPEVDPVPRGAIPEVWVKDQQARIAKTAETLDSAKPELRESLDLINEARTHPAKERSLGALGGLAKLTPEGQGFAAIMKQLGGRNFLAGYQKLKGTGNVSEIEGQKTEEAQARLTTAQTKEDFDKALEDLERSMRGAVERAERKMRQPVTAYQKTPDDPYAPDVGQVGTRGGKTVEYIGGDPSKDSSYRTVRR